jgi:hypothetical protein
MLVGYNTNVPYKGNLYHVQTEDSGIKNPVIITLLYYKGSILASKRVSYASLSGSPDHKEKVRELMKEQHKAMIKELIRGVHTSDSPPGAAPEAGDTGKSEPPRPRPELQSQLSTSLDDVLLDFIMKRGS